ncbi:MAG: protein translocase subunit SecD [Propionibacteriaceae bacterium]|nr:protein translocase subunit SecD [Propionibacteriaceae bacterium]
MATTAARRRHPGRILIAFFIVLAILATIVIASRVYTPKLGLDLSGGTTITLTASNTTGSGNIDAESLEQARTIIQQRVDSLGVGEAEITTSGNNQIQVSVPNVQQDRLVEMVGQTAQLEFRMVYQTQQATAAPAEGQAVSLPQPASETSTRPAEATTELPTDDAGRLEFLQTQLQWTPSETDTTDFTSYECGDSIPDVWDQPLFACLRDDIAQVNYGSTAYNDKFLLGPRIIEGNLVESAQAGIPQNELSWVVTLDFTNLGAELFADATSYLSTQTEPMNQFAIVLDGKVISAPRVTETIPDGNAQITGSFNQETATNLASVLNYGALPLAFEVSNVDNVSASLGRDQLTVGLIAGGIGLLLVIGFCVLYYRGLAVAVVASLAVAAIATYLLMVLLGESVGFALSLPALAGAVVAIGMTADSFVIFFERVRDEAREGRSIRTAVETGWEKARRTILIADAVSLLSAVILFILSIGAVKGFAFTLGLTTLVDIAMIFYFTKPLVSLLVKTPFFGEGKKFSGFEPEHLGVAATRRPRPRRSSIAATTAPAAKEA